MPLLCHRGELSQIRFGWLSPGPGHRPLRSSTAQVTGALMSVTQTGTGIAKEGKIDSGTTEQGH